MACWDFFVARAVGTCTGVREWAAAHRDTAWFPRCQICQTGARMALPARSPGATDPDVCLACLARIAPGSACRLRRLTASCDGSQLSSRGTARDRQWVEAGRRNTTWESGCWGGAPLRRLRDALAGRSTNVQPYRPRGWGAYMY